MTETVALKRADMIGPGGLEKLHHGGAISGDVSMSNNRGGVRFENMLQVMEFAKMMAAADIGVPKHLRANPGACLRVALQADEWGFSPFAVADKSYLVNDRLAYESQLVHAVVERRAPLEQRLRPTWSGDGPTRRCKITGILIGERDPFIWEGPMFKDIKIKNSPEWTANPDKQLFYHASRDWARIYVPDVLLGVYSRDELEDDKARAAQGGGNPGTIADRLPKQIEGPQDGFDSDGIARTLGASPAAQAATAAPKGPEAAEAASKARKPRKPAAEPADEPQPDETPQPPAEPTTNDEYQTYALGWIQRTATYDDAAARWDGEKELRAQCRVTVTTRKSLEKAMKAAFEQEK